MGSWWQDVKHGARMLRRNPAFTIVVVVTLALGIGANTAIFSVVHAVILRPLPYPEPDRIVVVHTTRNGQAGSGHSSSLPDYEDWRNERGIFQRMALFAYWTFNLTGRDVPERIVGARVTGDFFSTIAARPLLGRTLTPEDDRSDTPETVVLGYGLWQRTFGGDTGILGQVLPLNGRPHTVVGVMPPEFRFPEEDVLIWAALKDNMSGMQRHNRFMYVFGRLAPGITLSEAQAAMNVVAARLEREHLESNKAYGVRLLTAHETLVGGTQNALLVLLGAVGCVLLIACANVGNLLLARTASRQREYAVRAALGAGRRRLLRQFLTENLLLALAGGALGVAVGEAGVRLLLRIHPGGLPRLDQVELDATVLGAALLLTLVAGVALGLLPALQFSRINLQGSLKEGARSTGERRHGRMRSALVVAEVAVAVVLLVGGGLLLRSFAKLLAIEPGFATSRAMSMSVFLTPPGYRTMAERVNYCDRALANLLAVPGVEAAAVVTNPPLGEGWASYSFYEEGQPVAVADAPLTGFVAASEDYFSTLEIPLVAGRSFAPTDQADAPRVLVVNESFVRRMWPNETAIGKRLRWADAQRDVGPLEIVGVVRDARTWGLDKEEGPTAYAPVRQVTFPWVRWFSFVVRTAGAPEPLMASLRDQVLRADPDRPVYAMRTLEDALEASLAVRRFNMLLLEMFAAVALALAVVGIYGVISYTVTQRTQEIGVRIALGAQRADIWRLVVRGGMLWTLAGVALGLGGALVLTRYLQTLLFTIEPTDPATYAAVAATLLLVALAACWWPARRATLVEPMVALRHE